MCLENFFYDELNDVVFFKKHNPIIFVFKLRQTKFPWLSFFFIRFFLNNHEKTLFVACSHTCAVRFPIYPQISYFFFIILNLTHSIFWAIKMPQEQARAPLIENRVRHVSPIIKVLMSNWTIIGMFHPSSHFIFYFIMLISPFLIALYFILVTMCFIFAFTNNAMAGSMSFLSPCFFFLLSL